jgi:hypothetical protein
MMVIIFVMKTTLLAGLIAELNLFCGAFASEFHVFLTHLTGFMCAPLCVSVCHMLDEIMPIFAYVSTASQKQSVTTNFIYLFI